MKKTWHDAVDWADRVPKGVKLTVGDVEQEVLDRAPYILYLHERLQGFWSLCLPRSAGNQVVVALSGLAPICGGLAFTGETQFRNIHSEGLSTGVGIQVVWVSFLIGFACQVLAITGWLRVGRRTRESDSGLSGMLLAGSALTLVLAALIDEVKVSDIQLWPAWASLIAAVLSIAAFVLGGSDRPLAEIDVDRLTDDERQILMDQRDAALKIAAKRQLVRLRTVNRAVGKPLGSLIARPRD
ncbi:MAG: hypothetical protein ACRDSJ_25220 [Rubrobacteraceae bacterium]